MGLVFPTARKFFLFSTFLHNQNKSKLVDWAWLCLSTKKMLWFDSKRSVDVVRIDSADSKCIDT
jgi:hypothetical protein